MLIEVVAVIEDTHRRVRGPVYIPRVRRAAGCEAIRLYGAGAGQDHVRSVLPVHGPMVQRGYGCIDCGLLQAICDPVQPEWWGFRGAQCGRFGRADWLAWGLEDQSGATALHEERHNPTLVGVAGGHEPFEDPGAGCADRGRVRGSSAGDGGGRSTARCYRGPSGGICMVVRRREEKRRRASLRGVYTAALCTRAAESW